MHTELIIVMAFCLILTASLLWVIRMLANEIEKGRNHAANLVVELKSNSTVIRAMLENSRETAAKRDETMAQILGIGLEKLRAEYDHLEAKMGIETEAMRMRMRDHSLHGGIPDDVSEPGHNGQVPMSSVISTIDE